MGHLITPNQFILTIVILQNSYGLVEKGAAIIGTKLVSSYSLEPTLKLL